VRCDPLTISDACSRFLLRCQAVAGLEYKSAQPVFEAAFREYGMPLRMRNDNGTPFASVGIGGLSRLSIWWLQLGIQLERIRPGHPQDNGRHERMHRTLKQQTARPPKANLRQQQRAFHAFRKEYNEQRPHQALCQKTPAELFHTSPREYTGRLQEFTYADGWQKRKVGQGGNICWSQQRVFIGHVLTGEWLGLEPTADGIWKIWYRDYAVGIFSEREGKARSLPRPPFRRPDKAVPQAQ
jgi:hypothetical protein